MSNRHLASQPPVPGCSAVTFIGVVAPPWVSQHSFTLVNQRSHPVAARGRGRAIFHSRRLLARKCTKVSSP